MTILAQPYFRIEEAALSKLESLVWPDGPVCVHCGANDRIGAVTGKGARPGLKFCCRCRKQFRATMGTIFEGSHVPVHKWFQACFLLTASAVGISPHQLHLKLQITNKTALCLVQRLSESARVAQREEGWDRADAGWSFANSPRTRWCGRVRPPVSNGGLGVARGSIAEQRPFWIPPAGATRQFVGFVEAAREFGCSEEESRFEAVLVRLARSGLRGHRPCARLRPAAAIAAKETFADACSRAAIA